MKRCLLSLILVLATMTSVALGQQTATDAAATREDILKLLEVMHVRDQMKLVMDQVTQQMKAMSHDQLKKYNPKITDEEIAKIDRMSEKLTKEMPIDGMLEDMIPVYQRHLNKSDVDAMVGFYSTPTGQKILHEMPAMTAEGMQAMQPRLRKQMEETMEKIEQMAKEEAQKDQGSETQPSAPKN